MDHDSANPNKMSEEENDRGQASESSEHTDKNEEMRDEEEGRENGDGAGGKEHEDREGKKDEQRTYESRPNDPDRGPQTPFLHQIGVKPIPRKIVNKWMYVIEKGRRREKVRAILNEFFSTFGRPCVTCGSMKLTTDKFKIKERANHQRILRATVVDGQTTADDSKIRALIQPDDMNFGPNGLRLGTLREIHSRSTCPFCRLVIRSLEGQQLENAHPKNEAGEAVPISEQNVDEWPEKESVCWASWQVDGRILKRKPGSKEVVGARASTRRIRIHWDWPKFSDTYVVLMASPTDKSPGLFLGKTAQAARVDAAAIRQWANSCLDDHGSACKLPTYDFSGWKSFFGVIDVQEMMLTALPAGEKYVTLSYTWGKVNFPMTTQKNIRDRLSYGGLRKTFTDLPRTLRDSIELVRSIGLRYLWIDSLCIIQDIPSSWTLNSRVMDLVYGNAYLNICAADGDSANAGLAGLNVARAPEQIIEQYTRDVRLLSTQPAENYIRRSTWDTRGWTFQERLLSPRNLIFVDGRIFFQCRTTARSVDIITEHPDAGWSLEFLDSPLLFLNDLPERPLAVYKKALELYMQRKLSRPEDILAAFNGIGNVVCEHSGGFLVYGLPSSHFDWALLWEARDAPEPRKDTKTQKFPSWSWCGWQGPVMEYKRHVMADCEDNLHEWLMYHTWITWYIRDGNGNLKLVWDGDERKDRFEHINLRWRGYSKPDNAAENTYDAYGREIRDNEHQWRFKSEDFKQILDACPFGVSIVKPTMTRDLESEAFLRNNPVEDMPFLQFFTWSAFFRLRAEPQQDFGLKFQRFSVLDYKDDWCGTILLDRLLIAPLDPDKMYEFIAISDAKHFDKSEYNGWAYYIPKEREESIWDLYYVLLIDYKPVESKSNIAYRVGLGKVFKEAFNYYSCSGEGKQWKEFILG